MHKILTIVLFLILAAVVHETDANISLGACSLSCNENEHQAHSMLGHGGRGVPGKHGPMGPKGSRGLKGDPGGRGAPGQSCECSDREEFTAKLAALQAQIDELKGRVQPTSSNPTTTESNRRVPTDWTQASNNLFYKYFDERVIYVTAKSKCASFGAQLVAAGMRTAGLRREIKNFFPGLIGSQTWIGLNDLVNQGSYVWSDGVESTRENTDWQPSQPDDPSHRCGYLNTDGKVYDYTCSYSIPYLCELIP